MDKQRGIYACYSPGRDRDQTSTIAAQVAMWREKAQREAVTIDPDHIYIDKGISGSTTQRHGFQAMIAAIEAGDFPDILYAKDDKRLFRNECHASRLVEWIWEQDVEIRYCLMDFGDPRHNDEQWFMQRQFHIIAELERRRKRTEVFEHQRQSVRQGFSNGGLPPYGYQRKEVITPGKKKKLTWQIHPKEEKAVKIAFEMHQRGVGTKTIAHHLPQAGFRSRRGGAMNKQTIAEWFRNPYPYAGCIVWNTRDHHLKPKPREQWVIVPDTFDAIISMKVADWTYQKAEDRRFGKVPKNRGKYLLSSMMRCSQCGASMIINSHRKRNQAFYVYGTRQQQKDGCTNALMLHQREAERQIIDFIKEAVLAESFLTDYFQRVVAAAQTLFKGTQPKVEQLQRKRAVLDRELDRLTYGFAKGVLSADVVKPKIDAAVADKHAAESDIRLHSQSLPRLPDIIPFCSELLQALDDPETQKAAVRGLIDEITVHPTAALDIQCSFKDYFDTIALRGIEPRFDG